MVLLTTVLLCVVVVLNPKHVLLFFLLNMEELTVLAQTQTQYNATQLLVSTVPGDLGEPSALVLCSVLAVVSGQHVTLQPLLVLVELTVLVQATNLNPVTYNLVLSTVFGATGLRGALVLLLVVTPLLKPLHV